jgi:hypothetical protein
MEILLAAMRYGGQIRSFKQDPNTCQIYVIEWLRDLVQAKALVRSGARAFGLKEAVARARCVLAEADLALVDPRESWTMCARRSESTQGYMPFEGIELSARVKATYLRGALGCENGKVLGPPRGRYRHWLT